MISIDEASRIIRGHQRSPPVQTVPIATDLGLRVFRVGGWPDNLSGKLKRDRDAGGQSGFAIFVNGNHPEVRRRFTIAHEISHFVLHQDMVGDELLDDALYRSGLSNSIEAAANRMAADILMPWHLLNKAIDSGVDTIPELAKKFDVSRSAMSIRLGVPYE